MLPLDPLQDRSSIARLLKGAAAPEVRSELERLSSAGLVGSAEAALGFAKGALALREGALDAAIAELSAAAGAFEKLGERRAYLLARCEAILAEVRRGPRSVFAGAIAELEAIGREGADDARVRAVATHYAATATRMSGDAVGTAKMLLTALAAAEGLLDERAKILNSLGTLYVVMGAFGAAESVLEHAAELHHQLGDAVGEAIANGQLGAAAMGMGDLERARVCLQKQEWLSSRVGDTFGRARALTFLADVAIDLGRPDDALMFARTAKDLAASTSPPLRMWIAYATRAAGRAMIDLGDGGAGAELQAARELFMTIGNPLGSALTEWDLARLSARGMAGGFEIPGASGERPVSASWSKAAWSLASLGLAPRVAQLLRDQRRALSESGAPQDDPRASEAALAAVSQLAPHLASLHEVELIYDAPDELSAVAARRTAAQRNLGRLAALSIVASGLFVAVIAARSIAGAGRALPSERASAALAGELPGVAVWVWPMAAPLTEIARDLAAMRSALGPDTRAALVAAPSARVVAPPFAGEGGAELSGVDLGGRFGEVEALSSGTLVIAGDIAWSDEAEALTSAAGLTSQRA
jgi:tetratricopeptide (TPR) repeat protein